MTVPPYNNNNNNNNNFDSVKQLDVEEEVHTVTTGAFTELYMDPHLEEKKENKEEITIEDFVHHDLFGAGCAFYEMFDDGSHLFQGKNNTATMFYKENYDRTNLMKSQLKPFEKNLIYSLTHKDPCKRVSMADAKKSPFFQDDTAHFQALNEVSEAIIHLDPTVSESKELLTRSTRLFSWS